MGQEGDAGDGDGANPIGTLRQTLLEIVLESEARRPEGVHLTHVGGQFAKKMGAPFEAYLGHLALSGEVVVPPTERKMVPFIERYCADLFDIDRPGEGVVRLTTRSKVSQTSASVTAAVELGAALVSKDPPPKYRKAVWLAFVRPLSVGLRRDLYLGEEGVSFSDVLETDPVLKPEAGHYRVDHRFVVGIPQDQPIDGPRVHQAIQAWLADSKAPLDRLIESETGVGGRGGPTVMDLLRVIDALPSDLASRWLIPAEVLRRLRKP